MCIVCGQEKSVTEMTWSNKSKGIKNKRCKACQKKKSHEHYCANKEYYAIRLKRSRQKIRDYIKKTKGVPCADCGKSYPYYVMEFDHVREKKKYMISDTIEHNYKISTIKNEIAKCDIVCANCHRERTHGNVAESGLKRRPAKA